MFKLGVTCLLFFNKEKEDPIVEVLKMAAKQYKEYFIFMLVDYTNKKLDMDRAFYLKQFLGVSHAPALRILRVDENILRN